MDRHVQAALEQAGWQFGDAADFLGMTDEERKLLDVRRSAARVVREARKAAHWTQQQLATRINTTQPRVALIERAAPEVSMDQLAKAVISLGGEVTFTLGEITGQTASKKIHSGRATKAGLKTAKGIVNRSKILPTYTTRGKKSKVKA